jgi:4-amino-4-deoxy-L-arabinose transferase-like glycosyltransferase
METRTRWIVTLLLLGLVARVGAALWVGGSFHFADEAIYVDAARRLSSGGGFGLKYRQAPAYPVFLLLLSVGFPAGVMFLRVTQAAVAAFGSLLVFWLGDRMFGRGVAITAGLVYALDPLLVISSGLLYPEAVAALLVPAVVFAAIEAAKRDALGHSALAGALLGILALLRPVALILPPVMAGWTILMVPARLARRLAHVGALGLAVLLVLTPWTVRNIQVNRGVVPVATAGTEWAPVDEDDIARRGLLMSIAHRAWKDPGGLVSRVSRQFVQFWELAPTRMVTDDPLQREEIHRRDVRLPVQPLFPRRLRDRVSAVSFGLELTLALVGLVISARVRWRQTLLPVALILVYAVGYSLFVAKVRYRIPVLPLLFLFTGAGAVAFYSFARRAVKWSREPPTS